MLWMLSLCRPASFHTPTLPPDTLGSYHQVILYISTLPARRREAAIRGEFDSVPPGFFRPRASPSRSEKSFES